MYVKNGTGVLKKVLISTPYYLKAAKINEIAKKWDYELNVEKMMGRVVEMPANSNLNDLVKALNSIGVAPIDLISILQALKKSGSLQADLVVI